jgi:uncharacterized protein (DUF39 family)
MDLAGSFDTYNATINPGSEKINGVVDTLSVTTENAGFQMVYTGSTYGWKLLEV